jgi:type IV pilus assembly protein PilY1
MYPKALYASKVATSLYVAVFVLAAAPSHAALTLSDTPLFLTVSVPPNIVLTLDDSGSMRRAYVPELPAVECPNDPSDCDVLDNRYWKSSSKNGLYYNPNVVYPAGKKADGTSWTTSFTAAYKNGFDTSLGTVDLSTSYRPVALYELKPTNSVTEAYMGHYASDMRCQSNSNPSPRHCQINNGAGGFNNTNATCTQSTSAARDAFCRGLEDSGYNPSPAPAYYYVFNASNTNCSGTTAQKQVDNDCYSIVLVSNVSGPGVKDVNGDGAINASDKDERQNFANWYSFARTRNLAVKTATSIAFANLPTTTRIAWQALNTCRGSSTNLVDADCDGYKENSTGISNSINTFAGTHKTNFYNWLFQLPTNSGTPLPDAMKRVGEYYRTSGENSPYDNNFSTGSSGELACRRNYHVMFTDGIWTTAVSVGNTDNTNTPLPATVNTLSQYTAAAPYKDSTSNTLADVAFKYWIEDSRSTLTNNLTQAFRDRTGDAVAQYQNPRNDPATWQHMVNFTIGLGLTGYLKDAGLNWGVDMYSGSYSSLATGATAWPAASTSLNNPANVADLWHAAINSRGQFFSAEDPASLAAAFQTSINAITAGTGSNAALASNSTSLNLNNTVIYQAKFSQDWSGTLVALPISNRGVVGAAIWDANTKIPAAGSRKIFTRNNSTNAGVLFNDCANLSASQRLALNTSLSGATDNLCEDRMNWLRGDTSKEIRNGGIFRNRQNGVMGDVLASNPAYVKNINYGYSGMPNSIPGQSSYASFVSNNASRTPMVYVGSNDGKLYGFNATTGVENFSYIPGLIYSNLSNLTDSRYVHKFYVDGPVTVGDAYLDGSWKTMLLGGLNAGGKSIYALDITSPDTFSATNVKWEFTDSDMGYSFSQPQIGVLQSGQWVAVFGNGYNSTNGGSYLYIVDLATGDLLKKITATDTNGDETNGLSTPTLYDSNGDRLIDAIYAGDLLGNMWKFDVSNTLSASWGVAFEGAPLFRARNGADAVQPITSQPTVLAHPEPTATLVVFGTGRYLTPSDLFDTTVQSLYGLRDAGSAITTTNRSELQAQSFDLQGKVGTNNVRRATSTSVNYGTKKGYYLDFVNPVAPTTVGERVTSQILVKGGKVIIISITPKSDPCSPGGTSNLTELSASSGGALGYNALDLNGDLEFTADDKLGDSYGSSVELNVGLASTVLYLEGDEFDAKAFTGTENSIGSIANCKLNNTCEEDEDEGEPEVRRRSWIQIR